MEFTEVRVTLRDEPRLKAFVNVTFDDDFVIRGMKVIEGRKGLFVAMPSRKGKDGTFRDIAHPINNTMRKRLEKVVLDEYYSKCEEEGKSPKGSDLEQEDFEAPDENVEINALDEEEAGSEEEIEQDIEDIEDIEDDGELEEEIEEDLL
ncbi:septation regulator SpoVG [candidate division WOR-3 bacterium]|nr:septation regulator SpoVG [candidate division WOR-3 bacterium]